jgi:ATP-binding cassette subfamily C protein
MRAIRKRRIDLDTLDMAWRVEAGEASVMAEPAPESDLPRASATLLRVPAGGVIHGFSSEPLHGRIRVFLETTPGARLVPMLPEDLAALGRKEPEAVAEGVSDAVRQLAAWLSPTIPPHEVRKMLAPARNFRLPGGIRASAVGELWLRVDKGSCRLGGAEAAGDLDPERFYPLVGNMWVSMPESGRLICVDTVDVVRSGRFVDDFAAFAALCLIMAFERFSAMALGKFMRLMEGSRHRSQEFANSLERAVAVVDPELASRPKGPEVVAAVRAVGRALGCKITEPPRLQTDPRRQLEDTLDHNRLYSREVILGDTWREEDSGPLVAFLNPPEGAPGERETVALLPSGKKGYAVFTPRSGERRLLDDDTAARLEPKALQLYPPLPDTPLGPLGLARQGFRGCGRELALVGAMGLLGGLAGFGIPMAMSTTVDTVITNGEYGLLWQVVFGLVMITLGQAIFEMTKNAALLRAETRAQVSLQSAVFGKVLKLPLDFFKNYPAGDLSSRVMAVDSVRQRLSGSVLITLLSCSFALTNLALLAVYSWKLALGVLAILSLTLLATWALMKSQMKFQSQVQNAIGKLAGLELQLISGINKLRAAGAESNAFGQWMETFSELRGISYSIGKGMNVVSVYTGGLPLFTSLMVFGIFMLGGLHEELSLGSFLCFNSAMGQLTGAVASLCSMAVSLMFIKPMYQRAKPILEAKPETHPALEDPGELNGAVEAVGVSFAYPGAGAPTLMGVAFKAEPGEFVAIVGPSGSGKSTLLKLLLGFHKPSSGSIFFDGKPLRRLDPVKVRRQIGSVIQNGELIQGNLFFNIMGATADATEDDAWEAARMAALDDDIRAMPMGMHTFVPHGGGTFSGGQRQRIMLARALSKKPRIFLLDEATSNLDNETQAQVMRNLRHINATRIVVAHRLSTIRDADRIYVMHLGRVVETGNYEQLMKKNGLFTKLATRQIS